MKYPVVDPNPPMTKVITNLNVKDVGAIFLFTTVGFAVGWFGARKPLRSFNSQLCAGIGLLAGTTYGLLGSSQRFMGLERNDDEVRKYGIILPSDLKVMNDKLAQPNRNLIDSSVEN